MNPITRQWRVRRFDVSPRSANAKEEDPPEATGKMASALDIRVMHCPVCPDEFFAHEGVESEDGSLFCSKGCRNSARERWPECREEKP